MTNEEKQLLLIDISGRFPYGLRINIKSDYTREMEDTELTPYHLDGFGYNAEYRNLRPYLRPMSSMTEEEEDEYMIARQKDIAEAYIHATPQNAIDWLNEHHFDYRGLIEKSLAIEAPKGMYKSE